MKYLLTYLLLCVSLLAQTTIKPLTQDNIEAAITDDAGFQTAIGVDSALGLKVDASLLSTTGGANKVPQFDADGYLWTGAATGNVGGLRIPAQQRLYFNGEDGEVAGWIYNFGDHNDSYGILTDELILECGRICFYWTDAIQIGSASASRGRHYLYLNRLGDATLADPNREAVAVVHAGRTYSGGNSVVSNFYQQWVPSGVAQGSYDFRVATETLNTGTATQLGSSTSAGKISSVVGSTKVFGITHNGPSIPLGKTLTFGDSTTLGSTTEIQDMIDASIPVPRVGHVEMVNGTSAQVADAAIGPFSEIFLTHKVIAGDPGFLSATKEAGVGFTVTSSNANDDSLVSYQIIESTMSDEPTPEIEASATTPGYNEVGETLTLTVGTGSRQWYSGASPVSGETGTTYVIRAADIGAAITCQVNAVPSNAITAWHPDDESGFFAHFRADYGLKQTIGGANATVNGQAVAQWVNETDPVRNLQQSDGAKIPSLDLTDPSNPKVAFETVDWLRADTTTNASFPAIPRPQTAFVVFDYDWVAGNTRIFTTAHSGVRMTLQTGYNPNYVRISNSAEISLAENTPVVATLRATTTQFGLRLNDAVTETLSTEATIDGNSLNLGCPPGSVGTAIKVRNLIFYTADLDIAAQTRVKKYLYAKHSITP